ncbi:uncharacterized protein LOC118736971 [Rhagoletis pomonella]|uniref:uncharacterized protein LOC118736971 n=1 Tax=Rhagoletis pomonella TaxID=28610 RepID=UPI00177FF733|nr:uncharacterized protein LOC118736971 [Rhagoletis pomonella]XP_036323047.1 uncharacterized protein LOC118736971 [Rhagoletis pomonella]
MNRELVENILTVLKTSTDKRVVIKGLVKLRTDVVKDQDGIVLFRLAGGVPPMVRFLNKPHENILEVALSILGNCCTDEESCKEALQYKVAFALTTILKSIPNPVIQCRACRLLGNLAKGFASQLLTAHCPAIAQAVCQIITETSDVNTRLMAFRACRFLLPSQQFTQHFLAANGFVMMVRILTAVMKTDAPRTPQEELFKNGSGRAPVVGLKNSQHREKYFEEVARNLEGVRSDIFDHELLKNQPRSLGDYAMPEERAALDLAGEIFKCLLVLAELPIGPSAWKALSSSNCTFAAITFFITEENPQRGVALKIISNFSKQLDSFHMLSSADAVLAACELLVAENMTRPLTESEKRHCIHIICMLSPDACNRAKIRRSGALRKLIAMVRDSQSNTEKSQILYLLNNFQYDNMSMDLMLREGLVPVIIGELNTFLTSDEEYYKRKREEKQQNSKKRKLPTEVCVESKSKMIKVQDKAFLIDCESPSSSPRSYNTPSSPCSSRSMSPVGNNLFKLEEDASDDETYSPVCSDEEDDEDGPTETNNEANPANVDTADESSFLLRQSANNSTADNSEIMRLLDIACQSNETIEDNLLDKEEDDEQSQDVPYQKLPQLGNMPRSTLDHLENLLFRVTLLINKRGELGKSETMTALIKAINTFGTNNNFASSLTNILQESQFFAQVIRSGIAHQLYQLTKSEEINKDGFSFLVTLTCVGESNYGKAELARFLRSGDEYAQKRAAITVAYIIKSQRLLYQFLNDGNALSLLLQIILSEKSDEFTAEAVDALTAMSKYTLGISVPRVSEMRNGERYEEFVDNESKPLHETCDMRFVVHTKDATTGASDDPLIAATDNVEQVVEFSKDLLCNTSEVFNTMLNSDFKERNEGEIHLRTCSVSGLRYFLNLIVRRSQKLKYNIPNVRNYQAILEAFEMARVYIISEMETFLQQMLIGMLDDSNCLTVLEWSLRNYHAELTETVINYYLCSTLTTEAKIKLFHTADYSEYSTEWFQMIIDAIFTRCRNGF